MKKVRKARLQLMLPAKAQFLGFDLTADMQALADIGCTVFAVANPRVFPRGILDTMPSDPSTT